MSKVILLPVTTGPFNSKGLLTQVLSMSPASAITVGDMRKRVRMLDIIETAIDEFTVETDDYNLLKAALLTFPFNAANRQILQTVDAVIDAPDGPVITKAMREAAKAQPAIVQDTKQAAA